MTDENITIEVIADSMISRGLPEAFVTRAKELSAQNEGVLDLLYLWFEADADDDREEAVADLAEAIQDHEESGPSQETRSSDELDALLEERRKWKAHLRKLVEERGGVSHVARLSGIPQPSLSRILNTMSEPRPATLLKIADALELRIQDLRPVSDESTTVETPHAVLAHDESPDGLPPGVSTYLDVYRTFAAIQSALYGGLACSPETAFVVYCNGSVTTDPDSEFGA